MRIRNFLLAFGFAGILFSACEPSEEEGPSLPAAPSATFTWSFLPGDENRVIFEGEAGNGFLYLWDFGNGQTSNAVVDTIYFPQKGSYTVKYSVFNEGGMGEATQTIDIAMTQELPCEGALALLTGCDNQKTWIFAQDLGAISVGPAPYSTEWYASPAGGLVVEQYDDSYQFTFDGAYIYENEGSTINPFEGYISNPLEVPELNYQFSLGTGTSGEDQIIIPSCWFMGVWDSGPIYDIVELTETRLVIHSQVQEGDCSPGSGFFTLIFEAQ